MFNVRWIVFTSHHGDLANWKLEEMESLLNRTKVIAAFLWTRDKITVFKTFSNLDIFYESLS